MIPFRYLGNYRKNRVWGRVREGEMIRRHSGRNIKQVIICVLGGTALRMSVFLFSKGGLESITAPIFRVVIKKKINDEYTWPIGLPILSAEYTIAIIVSLFSASSLPLLCFLSLFSFLLFKRIVVGKRH